MKRIIICVVIALFASLGINAQFLYSPKGIGPVENGADFNTLPAQVDGLYDGAEFVVLSGSYDREGIQMVFKKGEETVIAAELVLDDDQLMELYNTKYLKGTFPAKEGGEFYKYLLANKITKLRYVEVTPAANAYVEIGGEKYSVSDPVVKFMQNPKSFSIAMDIDGVLLVCNVGDLSVYSRVCFNTASFNSIKDKLENQGYSSVNVEASAVNPAAKASRLIYE
ncbi:MAG: hypothetical protein HUK15_06085 [Bacteroidales bacterium]|nr:hypothetical protein [Bacteroidales bacterium]